MKTAAFPQLYVHEMWTVFDDPDVPVIEIRCIWPKGIEPSRGTTSRCFDQTQYQSEQAFRSAVESYVTQMNEQGFNLYATLNPIKAGMGQFSSAKDVDVICRRRFLIDIDRDVGKDHPATDADIAAAKSLGDRIASHLDGLGWPVPVRILSGNGHHLIYTLDDLPTSKEVTSSIKDLLHILKTTFSSNGFSVDTSVSNPSRVTKIPGTLARRGTEITNHPYRVARIYA
jgi:hypothetical protein